MPCVATWVIDMLLWLRNIKPKASHQDAVQNDDGVCWRLKGKCPSSKTVIYHRAISPLCSRITLAKAHSPLSVLLSQWTDCTSHLHQLEGGDYLPQSDTHLPEENTVWTDETIKRVVFAIYFFCFLCYMNTPWPSRYYTINTKTMKIIYESTCHRGVT